MSHFHKLDLPTFELADWIVSQGFDWGPSNQICINSPWPGNRDYLLGTGSLQYDWANKRRIENPDGSFTWDVPEFEEQYSEIDFRYLTETFRDTPLEEVYNLVSSRWSFGRVRLMRSQPKTCLSWHTDTSPRLHYPINTQEGCLMVVEDEVKHMPADTWWMVDTTLPHTAMNASRESRVHLVAVIL